MVVNKEGRKDSSVDLRMVNFRRLLDGTERNKEKLQSKYSVFLTENLFPNMLAALSVEPASRYPVCPSVRPNIFFASGLLSVHVSIHDF